MKKGGRPKKENKKDISISFFVDMNENKILTDLFKLSNYKNKSDMYRDILLKNEFKIITTDNEMLILKTNILHETKRIGNNFNQLIKQFNQKKTDNFDKIDIENIVNSVKKIELLFKKINENLSK